PGFWAGRAATGWGHARGRHPARDMENPAHEGRVVYGSSITRQPLDGFPQSAGTSPPARHVAWSDASSRTIPVAPASRRLVQRWQLLALAEHRAELVATLGHPVQHRPDREAIGPQRRIVELVPGDRRRDRRARRGARAVGRDEGLVVDVLGVVEPGPPAPLAFVPFPAHQLGHDRTDRLGQLLGPGAGVLKSEPGRDRYPDVNAAAPGALHR